MCPSCVASLAAKGYVCGRGSDVQRGLVPSAGSCGAVDVEGAVLPPPESKFQGFRDLSGRLKLKKSGGKSVQVGPTDLARITVEERNRTRCRLVGAAIAGATPLVSHLCLYNALKAVLCRVFRSPKETARFDYWAMARRMDDFLLHDFCYEAVVPMSILEWIGEAPLRRKKALFEAAIELGLYTWRDAWRWFSSFLKGEKLPFFEAYCGHLKMLEAMVDRLIQGPHDCTHLIVGPLVKPLTKRLKRVWHNTNCIFYAAVSVEKLDEWFNLFFSEGSWGLMCDYTMFDNSHSSLSWSWVESLYHRLGLHLLDSRFPLVMDAWREPHGRLHGKGWTLTYMAYIMNASGRDDTALANALLNGVGMFLSLCAVLKNKRVPDLSSSDIIWGEANIRLSVCGDDSLAILPQVGRSPELFCQALSLELAGFGFTAGADKMKVSQDPFDFVYLGMRPYPHSGKWWFAKTIGRALWKLGWRLDSTGDDTAWMAGNCEQVASTQQIVPLYIDAAEVYLSQHRGPRTKVKGDQNRPWQRQTATPKYNEGVLEYVSRGYDIQVSELRECIRMIRGTQDFPTVWDHPVLTRIMCVDEM